MSKCRYCTHWKTAKKRDAADPGKRFCDNIQKWVEKEGEVCEYSVNGFNLADFFWCDSSMHNCSTLYCIKKQELDIDGDCKFCTQGEEVALAFECWVMKLKRRRIKLLRRAKI